MDAYAEKYKGMAIISEIVKITPANVRLAGVTVQLGPMGNKPKNAPEKNLLIDGIISGERINFESALAGYMVKLERSPMFRRPEILMQAFEQGGTEQVLRFSARVEVI